MTQRISPPRLPRSLLGRLSGAEAPWRAAPNLTGGLGHGLTDLRAAMRGGGTPAGRAEASAEPGAKGRGRTCFLRAGGLFSVAQVPPPYSHRGLRGGSGCGQGTPTQAGGQVGGVARPKIRSGGAPSRDSSPAAGTIRLARAAGFPPRPQMLQGRGRRAGPAPAWRLRS